jgi:hypothetical protein
VARPNLKRGILKGVKMKDSTTQTHPAYGVITLGQAHCSNNHTLFGSDIGHHGYMTIEIEEADLNRSLGSDWIHGTKSIVKIQLSHAQFVNFITSSGNGSGTPCTIEHKLTEAPMRCPAIEKIETKHDLHKKEIADSATRQIKDALDRLRELEILAETGKLGKKAVGDKLHSLRCTLENLPSNLEFSVSQAQVALENAVSDAKVEVESYIATTAQRIGLENISQLAQIGCDSLPVVSK